MLGEFEQLVLLAILRAGPDAYGIPIQGEIVARSGRDPSLGSTYRTLARLEEKGYVSSHLGKPTAERGGRAKRCYAITAPGRRALQYTFSGLRRMAAGLDVGLEPR